MSERSIHIALIQQHATRDKMANLERGLAAAHHAAEAGAQLICFAELAFEWFHPQYHSVDDPAALAEPLSGPITTAFKQFAAERGIVVVINLYERDGTRLFDSSPVIDADGRVLGVTRMVHITDFEAFHERDYYHPSDRGAPVYETAIGRLGVCICYDRHYPEYVRAMALGGAEVVIVPQAGAVGEWPEGLYEAEMRVAAFQNGYYTALCNRVGREDALEFAGESFVCGPDGRVIARAPQGADHTLHATLDLAAVGRSHARRLFIPDRRPELYTAWLARDGEPPA